MFIVHVDIQVKQDCIEAFKAASLANARASVQEAGIARFDVLQSQDDPSRFVLVEVYRSTGDPGKHKQTAHYATWASTVETMMAQPRSSKKYVNLFPEDEGW
jgi:autoinducer 2-degrading protein